MVNFWHASHAGEYDMAGYFYAGYIVTDAEGRYQLTTIIPGAYQPREAKHLHVKVQAISRPVTTQLFIEGKPGNTDERVLQPAAVRRPAPRQRRGAGAYDFVIEQFDNDKNVGRELRRPGLSPPPGV